MEISLAVSLCLILAAVLSVELKMSSAVIEVFSGLVLVLAMPSIADARWLIYLAHLGMLALMFVAGFEVQVNRFRTIWKPSLFVGAFSFLVPFTGIYMYTHMGLGFDKERAALIAIALSTTSLALVYHVLKEHKILSTDEGQLVFGAASVVDVLSMIALAMLLGNAGWGTAIFLIALAVTALGLPRFGEWVFRRYPDSLAEPELRFLMVVLVAMGSMAEIVGDIHPALVAFTLGMIMAGVLDKNEAVKDKMMSLVFSFFAPLFFLQAGTRIQLNYLTPEFIFIGVVLFTLATVLKYFATSLPARFLKIGNPSFVGILFNYRLSFGIVAANVGLEEKLLTPEMFAVILLAVISSAALPGILLRKRSLSDSGDKPAV